MPSDQRPVDIIETGAAQAFVTKGKSARFDDFDRNPKAGPEAQGRAHVLWNIRLKESEPHNGNVHPRLVGRNRTPCGNVSRAKSFTGH